MKVKSRNGIAILVVVAVVGLLASSVVVNVAGIVPNQLGQGIQNFIGRLTGQQLQTGSVYGVPFIIDTSQHTMTFPVQPLSSVSASVNGGNPVTIYDSSAPAQGAVGDTFYVNVNIQNGTDTAITVSLNAAIQRGIASLQTASLSGSGSACAAPCSVNVNIGQIARGGGSVFADFGGASAAASVTYAFIVTGGQVCVTFVGKSQPLCHSLAAATVDTASLSFAPTPPTGPSGAFTATVTSTPSTQQSSGSTGSTGCLAGGTLVNGRCYYSAFDFYPNGYSG